MFLDTHTIRDFKRQIEEMSRSTQISILAQLTSDNIKNASAIFNCSGISIDHASYDTPTFVFGGRGCAVSISVTKKQAVVNTTPGTLSLMDIHPPVCAVAAALACQELLRLLGEPGRELPFCIKIDGDSMRAIYE